MISHIDYLFICLLAICMSSLDKGLFMSFAQFLIGFFVVFFGVGFCKFLNKFWILTPYQMYHW